MALADLLARLERRADTPDTSCNRDEVSAKSASIQACTLDTPDTPQNINGESETPKPETFPDDRRTCDQCANLEERRCLAAWRGEIVASRDYEPVRDLPRRCEGYMPSLKGAVGQQQVYCKDLQRDLAGAHDGKET